MLSELQQHKLKEFKKYLNDFLGETDYGLEGIHKLRLRCRELYSLFGDVEPSYQSIAKEFKNILKKTNSIRDLDVFLEKYGEFLSGEQIDRLEYERLKDVDELDKYLKHLQNIKAFKIIKNSFNIEDKKELHRYRIYIKKLLYREKNEKQPDPSKIKSLSNIKDILGSINDNYNALDMFEELNIKDEKLIKKVKKRNKELFEKFNYLYSHHLISTS